MKKEISKESRQELTEAIRQRYAIASKQEKATILDEFVSLTGYHRKHAIRLLGSSGQCTTVERPVGKRIYDEAVKEALIVLWEASDRICGKRLKAVLPVFIETMERNGHLDLDPEVKRRLIQMSASTIDRLLAEVRQQAKGRRKKRNAPKKASKGILLKAWPQIKESIPNSRLIIAGQGNIAPYRRQLSLCSDVEVYNKYLTTEEVSDLMKKVDVLALPYIDASQSGVLTIGQAYGMPVIATRICGIQEQIENGVTGVLVEPGNGDQLAGECIRLLPIRPKSFGDSR